MSESNDKPQASPALAAPNGSACPSCCSLKVESEPEDSVTGFVMRCRECGWTWCPSAAEEAKIMADALYGYAMPNALGQPRRADNTK